MTNLNDLTVIIVTFRTNKEILYNCIDSIESTVKVLIIENSDDIDFKVQLEKKYQRDILIIC